MLLYVIIVLVFITGLLFYHSVIGVIFRSREIVQIRLDNITKQDLRNNDNELGKPLFARILRPMLDGVNRTVLKVTPKEIITSLGKKVQMAGNPKNLTVKDWINIQIITVICLPLITAGMGFYLNLHVKGVVFAIVIEIIMGLVIPNFILGKKITDRQKKIQNTLPDVIDLLTVSVEAGLGFDAALSKVTDKMPGPLADEFDTVLQEIKVGKQKREALKDMADRINMQDLSTFLGSVIQADQFGVSIGNVLRIQSEQMRQKRRQRAQEKAMKAPIKMLIPMVLFIFPTLFIVLLGPILIKVIDLFTGK
jgi:tight adherence protein C